MVVSWIMQKTAFVWHVAGELAAGTPAPKAGPIGPTDHCLSKLVSHSLMAVYPSGSSAVGGIFSDGAKWVLQGA